MKSETFFICLANPHIKISICQISGGCPVSWSDWKINLTPLCMFQLIKRLQKVSLFFCTLQCLQPQERTWKLAFCEIFQWLIYFLHADNSFNTQFSFKILWLETDDDWDSESEHVSCWKRVSKALKCFLGGGNYLGFCVIDTNIAVFVFSLPLMLP